MKKLVNYYKLVKNSKTDRNAFLRDWAVVFILSIVFGNFFSVEVVTLVDYLISLVVSPIIIFLWNSMFEKTIYTESAEKAKSLHKEGKSFFFNNVNNDLTEDFFN